MNIQNLTVAPKRFRPPAQEAVFRSVISRDARVTLQIAWENGTTVLSEQGSFWSQGLNSYSWLGNDPQGAPVEPGTYTIYLADPLSILMFATLFAPGLATRTSDCMKNLSKISCLMKSGVTYITPGLFYSMLEFGFPDLAGEVGINISKISFTQSDVPLFAPVILKIGVVMKNDESQNSSIMLDGIGPAIGCRLQSRS